MPCRVSHVLRVGVGQVHPGLRLDGLVMTGFGRDDGILEQDQALLVLPVQEEEIPLRLEGLGLHRLEVELLCRGGGPLDDRERVDRLGGVPDGMGLGELAPDGFNLLAGSGIGGEAGRRAQRFPVGAHAQGLEGVSRLERAFDDLLVRARELRRQGAKARQASVEALHPQVHQLAGLLAADARRGTCVVAHRDPRRGVRAERALHSAQRVLDVGLARQPKGGADVAHPRFVPHAGEERLRVRAERRAAIAGSDDAERRRREGRDDRAAGDPSLARARRIAVERGEELVHRRVAALGAHAETATENLPYPVGDAAPRGADAPDLAGAHVGGERDESSPSNGTSP